MASFSFARQSQPAAAPAHNGDLGFLSMERTANGSSPNDPLQPLRAMADRVGKEVEKFAERVDHWHTHGNESLRAKYQTTVKMVGKFRDVAETHVKELKRAHAVENKGELERSVRRRIQSMAEASDANAQSTFGQSNALTAASQAGAGSPQLRDLRSWQAELATWELVRLVIEQHHPEPETDPAAEKQNRLASAGGNKRYSPNNEIWDRFLLEDDKAKEKAIVLRWLEQTARNDRGDIELITAELEGQSGKGAHTWTSGWLDTKSKIKQAKRLEGTDQPLQPNATLKTADRMQDLVTQLDPDGPARQKRALEKSDDYYERALWMVCYEMLRRGMPWKDICEWAQERNEAWRGVSVGAAYEAHPNGGPNVAGPTVGYLFRRMCFYAARGARMPYEGAVYGLLSGDLKQVQAVCNQSWDDHLHTHYNALLLSRFDTYLQQNHPTRISQSLTQKFVFQDAVANIGDWEHASQEVIRLLKQQKSTEQQAITPSKLIQGALISRNIDELLLKVGTALADMLHTDPRPVNLMLHPDSDENDPGPEPVGDARTYTAEKYYQALASDPHAFRVLVHVAIAFRGGLGAFHESETVMGKWLAMDNVIAAYIEFLRISKRIQLIPLYAAQLTPERGAHCLARVLPDIKNSEEQRRCVNLLDSYRIDIVEVVSQSFLFAFKNSGFTHFDEEGNTVITNPIKRFKILERTGAHDFGLWPGYRIQQDFAGSTIEPKEDAVIEALQWYHYVGNDYKQTFEHLKNALTIFLLNGRFGAAEKVVNDLSVEALSLSRTEALCGYPFDFTQPGAEEQDEGALHEHRTTLSNAARQNANSRPNAEKHAAIVDRLREKSAAYYELQQIVRILLFLHDWRHEEEELIKVRAEQARQVQEGTATKKKADMNQIKELLENIEAVFTSLIASISDSYATNPALLLDSNAWALKRAYMPEIVLAYLSVLQTAAFFLQRDSAVNSAVKAMEIANLVADEDNEWLQKCFLETGRMSELVDALAMVSKAMLRLNEHEPTKKAVKKRASKGETLRIWDLNNRDRV